LSVHSYLYVPGDRPDRFTRAATSGTDAIILDLEDAVPVQAKDEARAAAAEFVSLPSPDGTERWVRINVGDRGTEDLAALSGAAGLTGIFLPKATPDAVAEAKGLLGELRLVALVESAAGVMSMATLAGLDRVDGLALGEIDLAADLGMSPSPDGRELWPIRLDAVVASTARGAQPPVGPVWVDIADLDGLRSSTEELCAAGFGARQAIHPTQVAVINEAFTPGESERERAAHLIELADRAGGGVCIDDDGRMVDEAVLRTARRILDQLKDA
jgi:citrate lyase subunit beta/citryl-CoA lyase